MTLCKGEDWLTVGRQVQAYTWAANVPSHAPYLVGEAYYFRTVDGSTLREQGLHFIVVVAGRHAGYSKSLLQGVEDSVDQQNELPLNLGELPSPKMQACGQFAETHYDMFLNKAAQQSTDFLGPQDPKPRTVEHPGPDPK